jgi:SAM-dependent methyltransferase
MNLISTLFYFYNRKIEPGFKIGKNALVVDIGSGEKPFWRADVFVDKLSLGNVQRASKFDTIHDLGLFVDSDVAKMPFKTHAFDFSFASHLLEHVDDPAQVIGEITRISKAGYVEMPNGVIETIEPFGSHLWFVFRDKKKLIFIRKGKKLHEILTKNGKNYGSLLGKVNQPFNRLYWKKKIDFEIVDPYQLSEKFNSEVGNVHTSSKINYYLIFTKILRFLFYKNKPMDRLKNTLRK